MSNTTADLPELPPPTAGADIHRALADVDAKLSAWVEAMTGAQATLTEAPRPAAVIEESPEPTVEVEESSHTPGPVIASEPAVPKSQDRAGSESPAEAVAQPAARTGRKSRPSGKSEAPAGANAAGAASSPSVETSEDDEALLASLGPETAKAIRVMRRLSFEKKSVRELLEEYASTRSGQDGAEQRKKSWWSRG